MNKVTFKKMTIRRKLASVSLVGILSATLLLFQNCSKHDAGQDVDLNSLQFAETNAKAVQLIETKCASCHQDATDVTQLETMGWLVIGDPANSKMYLDSLDQLEPRDENYLTDDELNTLRDWISQMGDNWETVIKPPEVDGSGNPIIPGTYQYVVSFAFGKCMGCHSAANNGAIGGGVNLESFNVARNRANAILREMQDGTMPPQGAPATPLEIMYVQEWIDNGLPQQ